MKIFTWPSSRKKNRKRKKKMENIFIKAGEILLPDDCRMNFNKLLYIPIKKKYTKHEKDNKEQLTMKSQSVLFTKKCILVVNNIT